MVHTSPVPRMACTYHVRSCHVLSHRHSQSVRIKKHHGMGSPTKNEDFVVFVKARTHF